MTASGRPEFAVDVHLPGEAPLGRDEVEEVVLRVLRDEAAAPGGEVSVAFLEDEAIRDLNRRYLGRDRPTDVLAFRLADGDGRAEAPAGREGGDPPPLVGDVYVGLERARAQAEAHGAPLREELLRLVIHGVLHVLGHDHPEGPHREDSPMFRRQEELLEAVREVGRQGKAGARRTPGGLT